MSWGGVGVYVLASLASFDAADLPTRVAPALAEVHNLGGPLGAYGVSGLLKWVGTAATAALGVGCLAQAWATLRPTQPDLASRGDPLRRAVGAVIALIAAASLERLLRSGPLGSLLIDAYPAGGYWGVFVGAKLAESTGPLCAGLLSVVALGLGIVLTLRRPLDAWFRAPLAPEAESTPPAVEAPAQEAELEPAPVAATPTATSRGPVRLAPVRQALPAVTLLARGELRPRPKGRDKRSQLIEDTLQQFKVSAKVVAVEGGPAVTLFALELGRGIKVQRVQGLLDNLALSLRVPGIRLQAPIPGTGWVGLEVPNEDCDTVRLRELIEHKGWQTKQPALPVFLGRDSTGKPLIADLAKMPHLLIAGATGSGKSVCMNALIVSLLMTRSTRDVRLILIDPKQVEMTPYRKVPHLMAPVVTDMREAGAVLAWLVNEMEERYGHLARAGVRQISEYNELSEAELCKRLECTPEALANEKIPTHLPYIALFVDELNDLMMIAQKEVEASITRLAQKSRAVGIHVVLATQRPSVDVITGVIKSNLPARIAFRVASKVDSRTILDSSGADKLLGQGDMLFLPPGRGQPIRALGALVTDAEVRRVVDALKGSGTQFHQGLLHYARTSAAGGRPRSGPRSRSASGKQDPKYLEAVRAVLAQGRGSVSLIQRKLEVGYGRAARYLDLMCEQGIVGPARGAKPRELLITLDEWEQGLGRRDAA
ncbi:MAG: DNA translocase FtsK 4TM domain-containing protein [Planctomycetes bacterium]|nr:DNA translocase FtsK 4TM domain-containing protein [Planctomycetota bacterium]